MDKKKKRFSLYRLFNPEGNGLGVEKGDMDGPDGLKKCFKIYTRNITNLLTLNMLFIFGNFPIAFAIFAMAGYASIHTTAPESTLFGPLHGAILGGAQNPVSAALSGVHGIQTVFYVPTVWSYILLALSLLVIFTFGYVNTGVTHVLRSMVRGEPVSLWSDFFGVIKRNKKQGLIMGIIDAVIIGLLIYDITFFFINGSPFIYVNLLILAIYVIMRFYIYILLITFDLSIWKIIKNSLIFTILNFKRNIVALIGIVICAAFVFSLFFVFIPAGVVLAVSFLFSSCMYFGAYAAYPKIKEIMIDPQTNND